jgi:hypothetical protein
VTDVADDLTTAYMAGYHKRDDEVSELKDKIECLRRIINDGIVIAQCDSPYAHGTRVRMREWAKQANGALGVQP